VAGQAGALSEGPQATCPAAECPALPSSARGGNGGSRSSGQLREAPASCMSAAEQQLPANGCHPSPGPSAGWRLLPRLHPEEQLDVTRQRKKFQRGKK